MHTHCPILDRRIVNARLALAAALLATSLGCQVETKPPELSEPVERAPNLACITDDAIATEPGEVVGRYQVIDNWRSPWTCGSGSGFDSRACDGEEHAVEGASVVACHLGDLSCDTPIDDGITTADGEVVVDLTIRENGWDGYLEVTSEEDYFGGIYLRVPRVLPDPAHYEALALEPWSTASIIEQATGYRIPRDRAILLAEVLDCDGLPLPGVVVEMCTNADIGYEEGAVPQFDRSSTSGSGRAWAFDIAPGLHSVTARLEATGEEITTASVVPFKAGVVTRVVMSPTR